MPGHMPADFGEISRACRHLVNELSVEDDDDAIGELEQRWPGVRDRLCEPGPALRMHIHVYVDRRRAALDTPLADGSRVDVVAAISGG